MAVRSCGTRQREAEWYPKATESTTFLIIPKKNEKVKQRPPRVSRPCFSPWKNFRSLKAGDSSSQVRRITRRIPDFGILTFAF